MVSGVPLPHAGCPTTMQSGPRDEEEPGNLIEPDDDAERAAR
jgi:hypothetical protein